MDGSSGFDHDGERICAMNGARAPAVCGHDAARPGPPTARMVTRSSPRALAASAALGFVAGAVFWHMVGFWGFVSDVIFHTPAVSRAPAVRMAASSLKAQTRQSGIAGPVEASSGNCSVAPIDRSGGPAAVSPCDVTAAVKFFAPRAISPAAFGDFGPVPVPVLISGNGVPPDGTAPAVGGWSARVDRPADEQTRKAD